MHEKPKRIMMKHPHLAITNDDGIDSPGLRAAVEAVADLGTLTVVAPTDQQTATGRGMTGNRQSGFRRFDYRYSGGVATAYHCPCSPAQVVRHALLTVFRQERPDLFISGINYGENLGNMVTCSGTVGAALEAASHRIPAIAVSKQTDIASHHRYTDQKWEVTAYFLRIFVEKILSGSLLPDVDVLKIDVPADATERTDWKLTTLSRTAYYSRFIDNPAFDSRICDFETRISVDSDRLEVGSDIHALAVERIVSVTPLSIDLTSRVSFSDLHSKLNRESP
jgi:5'-nucleotidase